MLIRAGNKAVLLEEKGEKTGEGREEESGKGEKEKKKMVDFKF